MCAHVYMRVHVCTCMHMHIGAHMWFGEERAKPGCMDMAPCFDDSNEYQVELVISICV